MDISRIIGELRTERDRLTGIITALERLHTEDGVLGTPKRRGRKFMDKKARREVSERMKRYWAERRTASQKAATQTVSTQTGATQIAATHSAASPGNEPQDPVPATVGSASGTPASGHSAVRTAHANVAA